MPRVSASVMAEKGIGRLRANYRKLAASIAKLQKKADEITDVFARLGIPVEAVAVRGPATGKVGKKRGPKPGRKRGRKPRGKFANTGEESVLAFVKAKGLVTTADINGHWQSEKRGGKADNTLTKLCQAKKLVRVKTKGERGSRYQLP